MKNEGLQIKPRYIFWFIVYHVHADNVIFSAKYNLFTCMHKVDAEELIVPSTRARRGRLWALLRPTCVWNYNPVASLFLLSRTVSFDARVKCAVNPSELAALGLVSLIYICLFIELFLHVF